MFWETDVVAPIVPSKWTKKKMLQGPTKSTSNKTTKVKDIPLDFIQGDHQ